MGLLTDTRTENMKTMQFILQWRNLLSFLLYFGGIVWTALFATVYISENTYFSENALLPGLVTKESNLMHTSKQLHEEFIRELETQHGDEIPVSYLASKFRQLHLDTFIHNFSLIHPLGKQKFTGKNVYGIVRASRSTSTEAIVINVPYRSINTIHPPTSPSIVLLLAFAQFCRKQKYWAKDIIFLITEHEQLGMQAWLDAYHGVTSGQKGVLLVGDLAGRAGSIQAAIVLEIHAMKVTSIDVKVEGLNGQLPNLDLFNLAQNMIHKEEIRRTIQRRPDMRFKNKFDEFIYRGKTLTAMIINQASGVPTGNHGLFHRFGIEAITLEGFDETLTTMTSRPKQNFSKIGRVLESIVRSLNNLLERFHQSYFFYLLPSTDRFISIGIYTVPFVMMIATLLIKTYAISVELRQLVIDDNGDIPKGEMRKEVLNDDFLKEKIERETPDDEKGRDAEETRKIVEKLTEKTSNYEEMERKRTKVEPKNFDLVYVTSVILWIHIMGFLFIFLPQIFVFYTSNLLKWHTEDLLYLCFSLMTFLTVFLPIFKLKKSSDPINTSLLCGFAYLELGITLMCIELLNFSLALIITIIYVPLSLFISTKNKRKKFHIFLHISWLLVHPFLLISLIITIYTYINFSDESITIILYRGWKATKQIFVLSIMDSAIYGNWLHPFIVSIMLPLWTNFWYLIVSL